MTPREARPSGASLVIGGALAAAAVALAWWSPIAGDDWDALLRAHELGAAGALAAAHTPGALLHQLIAIWRPAEVVLAPLVVVALITGATALVVGRGAGRRPDVGAILVVTAALAVACPRLGVILTQRALVAHVALGLAAALWLFVPARTGRRLPLGLALVAGVVAGAGGRAIAAPALVGLAALAAWGPADARRRLLAAIAAVVAGAALATMAGSAAPALGPDPRGLILVTATGHLVLWAGLVLTGVLVAARLRGAPLPAPAPREVGVIGWLGAAGLAALALGAWSPGPGPVAWLAPTALFALAAARAILLACDAAARRVVVALAGAGVTIAVATGAVALSDASAQAHARARALAAAPGAIATAPPVTPIAGSWWTLGEDLAGAARRERIAAELFGARDLVLAPRFHGYEPSPADAFTATWTAAPPPGVPADWGRSPDEARRRFAAAVAGTDATGELDVDLGFPARAARPIAVARAHRGRIAPVAGRLRGRASHDRRAVAIAPARLAAAPEAWVVGGGAAAPASCDRAAATCWLEGRLAATYALVLCDHARCELAASAYLAP